MANETERILATYLARRAIEANNRLRAAVAQRTEQPAPADPDTAGHDRRTGTAPHQESPHPGVMRPP
ncbi:hypothetical protein, partial [Nocardia otitidiscaviarum]